MELDVLIVDDSALSRRFVRQCLEIAGLRGSRFTEATNGRQALDHLASGTGFRLVVTDLNMPEMDGEQLLQAIRNRPEWNAINVVVVTSLQNPVRAQALQAAGARAVLGKPLTPQLAAPVVEALLKELQL